MGCIQQVIFPSSAGQSVWYTLEVASTEYLLDPGVLGGHWFADGKLLNLRPLTLCFVVIFTSNWLNRFCMSFGLATQFSRRCKVAPLRFDLFGSLPGCEWLENPH